MDSQEQMDLEDVLVQVRRLQEIGTQKKDAENKVDGLKIQLRKAKEDLRMHQIRFAQQADCVGTVQPLPLFDRPPQPSKDEQTTAPVNGEATSLLPPAKPTRKPRRKKTVPQTTVESREDGQTTTTVTAEECQPIDPAALNLEPERKETPK